MKKMIIYLGILSMVGGHSLYGLAAFRGLAFFVMKERVVQLAGIKGLERRIRDIQTDPAQNIAWVVHPGKEKENAAKREIFLSYVANNSFAVSLQPLNALEDGSIDKTLRRLADQLVTRQRSDEQWQKTVQALKKMTLRRERELAIAGRQSPKKFGSRS